MFSDVGVLFDISIVCQLFMLCFFDGWLFLFWLGWLLLWLAWLGFLLGWVGCSFFASFSGFLSLFWLSVWIFPAGFCAWWVWFFVESLILAQDERWRRA